jgi:hypothetical protein
MLYLFVFIGLEVTKQSRFTRERVKQSIADVASRFFPDANRRHLFLAFIKTDDFSDLRVLFLDASQAR